ncbi:MAG: prepilin peptidase [Acidimicrobiales bacterium]
MTSSRIPAELLSVIAAGVFGLFVGSFLNVVIYRTPLGLSIARPRSFCTSCERQLTWWENVPVVSWLALRGRCRTCSAAVSPRYPMVELATGVVFTLVTLANHGSFRSAPFCSLAAGVLAVALIEHDRHRAPLGVAGAATGLAMVLFGIDAALARRWWALGTPLLGALAGMTAIVVLRVADPACEDRRGHGRTALLLAACWLGGLGGRPALAGVATGTVAYIACMTATVLIARRRVVASGSGTRSSPEIPVIFATPLVSALIAAMAVSLVAAT